MSSQFLKPKSMFENVTTLHGTGQFKFVRGWRSAPWTLAITGNMALTVIFILVITSRYNSNLIVTRINANCLVNQVPFPAVSICNLNLVSLRETSVITRILKNHNITEMELELFYESLQRLKDFDNVYEKRYNFTKIIATLKMHYFSIDTIMEEVHQKCNNLLVYCTFNGKVKNCNDFFRLIKTYEGYCCTFNYAGLNNDKGPQWTKDEDIEYYEDQSAVDMNPNEGIITTSQAGRGSGLSVVFDVEPADYPSWSPVPYYGAKITLSLTQVMEDIHCLIHSHVNYKLVLLSDPNDFPETTVLYKYINMGDSVEITVEPHVFQCENDVRRVDPLQRRCWFHNEVDLEHTDRYSYETCKTECKMRNYLKYCQCIPYKYPRGTSTKVCDFEDLQCLNNYTAFRSQDLTPCVPLCMPECRDKKYSITSDTTPFLRETLPLNVTEGHNESSLATLQVFFGKSTSNCYKLTLLMDFNYFIVTYGGVFSLTFGASILTVFEIAFLLLASFVNQMKRTLHTFYIVDARKTY